MSLDNLCPKVKFNRSLRYQQDIRSPVGRQVDATQVQQAISKPPSREVVREYLGIKDDKTNKQNNKDHKKEHDLFNRQRFNRYKDLLSRKGLLDNDTDRRRFITNYIDIDSSTRVKSRQTVLEPAVSLPNDPLNFVTDSNVMFIDVGVDSNSCSSYEVGDQIVISDVTADQVVLRTFDYNDNPAFEIKGDVMKIHHTHTSGYVEISGIKPDQRRSYLGDVPINCINRRHRILDSVDTNTYDNEWGRASSEHFFVKLAVCSKQNYKLLEYNFKMSFLTIGGLPLETFNNESGFTIDEISQNRLSVRLPACSGFTGSAGGRCVTVSKVKSFNAGYPNPNRYIIGLGKTYNNVISARLISSEFPNINKNVQEGSNKLHWNDLDNEQLNSVTVPSGNYLIFQLEETLNKLLADFYKGTNTSLIVTLDNNSSTALFKSFRSSVLVEPFVDTDPLININPALDDFTKDSLFTVTVHHPGHRMTSGVSDNTVVISNSLDHLGISADTFNQEFVVEEIVDEDNYKIVLPRINLDALRRDTKGGVAVYVQSSSSFRLRMDQESSIGSVIGFRDVGGKSSVTRFGTCITNNDGYVGESDSEVDGCAFQLNSDRYILMIADPLSTLVSVGPTKSAFAKIQLSNNSNSLSSLLTNTFVPTSRFYDDPLTEVYELDVRFVTERGDPVDFDCLDHSYTLELITVHDIPGGTGVSPNTGKNYNINA